MRLTGVMLLHRLAVELLHALQVDEQPQPVLSIGVDRGSQFASRQLLEAQLLRVAGAHLQTKVREGAARRRHRCCRGSPRVTAHQHAVVVSVLAPLQHLRPSRALLPRLPSALPRNHA